MSRSKNMAALVPLSPADLRQINTLTLSFPSTGNQAISLYRLASRYRVRVQAALIRAEMAGEGVYAGALRRLYEAVRSRNMVLL